MEAVKQKNTITAPNDLRKIPRMSTSSAAGHREDILTKLGHLRDVNALLFLCLCYFLFLLILHGAENTTINGSTALFDNWFNQ